MVISGARAAGAEGQTLCRICLHAPRRLARRKKIVAGAFSVVLSVYKRGAWDLMPPEGEEGMGVNKYNARQEASVSVDKIEQEKKNISALVRGRTKKKTARTHHLSRVAPSGISNGHIDMADKRSRCTCTLWRHLYLWHWHGVARRGCADAQKRCRRAEEKGFLALWREELIGSRWCPMPPFALCPLRVSHSFADAHTSHLASTTGTGVGGRARHVARIGVTRVRKENRFSCHRRIHSGAGYRGAHSQ